LYVNRASHEATQTLLAVWWKLDYFNSPGSLIYNECSKKKTVPVTSWQHWYLSRQMYIQAQQHLWQFTTANCNSVSLSLPHKQWVFTESLYKKQTTENSTATTETSHKHWQHTRLEMTQMK